MYREPHGFRGPARAGRIVVDSNRVPSFLSYGRNDCVQSERFPFPLKSSTPRLPGTAREVGRHLDSFTHGQ